MFNHESTQINTNKKKILYKELSYKIIGLVMEELTFERFVK
jgi:hypothetical protein